MNLILGILGIAVIVGIMWLISYNRKEIDWRVVAKAFIIQIILAIIVLKVPVGAWIIDQISLIITQILANGQVGLKFVFGSLMDSDIMGLIFIIHVLGNIIFVGALVSILTHYGVLGLIIDVLGRLLRRVLGTTHLESFVCVANMFLGITESPLMISKYVKFMTRSELFVVLVAGMGSMSAAILGGYSAMGIPMNALLLAAALVPFGTIMLSKIILPQTEETKNFDDIKVDRKSVGSNGIEALANGAMDGWNMVMAIAASLVAINAVIAIINLVLGVVGFSLQEIMGVIFYPVAMFMGVGEFTSTAAQIMGSKLVINEFIAFDMLVKYWEILDYRTQMVMSIGVAGFANIGSMAICLSGMGVLCPEKKSIVAGLIGRALVGAFSLNIMNAIIVGLILLF